MGKFKDFTQRFRPVWNFLGRHKYLLTIVVFLLIICVLDENNLIVRFQHKQEIYYLEKEIDRYTAIRDSSVKGLDDLANDKENLERVARERYGMHLPDEEVYVIK